MFSANQTCCSWDMEVTAFSPKVIRFTFKGSAYHILLDRVDSVVVLIP